MLDACHHGGGLPIVAAQADDVEARVGQRELLKQVGRPVAGAVIDEHDLGRAGQRRKGRAQRGIKRGQTFGFVEDRDDN